MQNVDVIKLFTIIRIFYIECGDCMSVSTRTLSVWQRMGFELVSLGESFWLHHIISVKSTGQCELQYISYTNLSLLHQANFTLKLTHLTELGSKSMTLISNTYREPFHFALFWLKCSLEILQKMCQFSHRTMALLWDVPLGIESFGQWSWIICVNFWTKI